MEGVVSLENTFADYLNTKSVVRAICINEN